MSVGHGDPVHVSPASMPAMPRGGERGGGLRRSDAPHLPVELTLYAELTQAVAVVDEHFRVWTPNFLQFDT